MIHPKQIESGSPIKIFGSLIPKEYRKGYLQEKICGLSLPEK
jgi:hypothetical protein